MAQTHFYIGIGKERACSGGELDFMLRNGRTLGIKLLTDSRGAAEHHKQFESNGQYEDLELDEFLV